MKPEPNNKFNHEKAEHEAASWMWKLDRGLTGAEQDAFFDWLSIDPQYPNLINEHKGNWERLDALAAWCPAHSGSPNPELLEIKQTPSTFRFCRKFIWLPLAAAASIALVVWSALDANPLAHRPATPTASAPAPTRLTLEDGSIIKLNDETRIITQFTAFERRVILERGEAFFMVAKDPRRPFIVEPMASALRPSAPHSMCASVATNVRFSSLRVSSQSLPLPNHPPLPRFIRRSKLHPICRLTIER